MPPQTEERPATYDEIISALAKKEGVPASLAVAVAKRESSLNPGAVGDGGKAIGLFQLHAGAAQDTGTTDRNDPIQNITGGVKYLKQLSDRYQGDARKVLMAYNGGMGNVDAGTISPAAQAYADEILGSLGKPAAQTVTTSPRERVVERARMVSPGGADRTTPEPPAEDGILMSMAKSFDPRTTEGRINLGTTAAATAASAWAGGAAGVPTAAGIAARSAVPAIRGLVARQVSPWIARVLAAPAAAGATGAGIMATEQAIGTAPEGSSSPLVEGGKQAALEAGGGLLFGWLPRRIARPILASRVGRQARETLEDLRVVFREGLSSARSAASKTMQAVRDAGGERIAQAEGEQAARATIVGGEVREARRGAQRVGREAVEAATRQSDEALADAELRAAEMVAEASKQYDEIATAPSVEAAGRTVRKVTEGMPGVGAPTAAGPAKRALDIVGKNVEEAAQAGEPIAVQPIKDALNEMAGAARPRAIFSAKPDEATKNIGFLQNVKVGPREVRKLAQSSMWRPDSPEFQQQLVAAAKRQHGIDLSPKALGVPENHPLPGILGQILDVADERITFADAHALKKLLDEAVNWDVSAKRHLTRLTKGIRVALRGAMRDSGNEAYEAATAQYAKLAGLYGKGVGRRLIKAAADNPDAVARMLNVKNPQAAQTLRSILIDQAAAGGDAKVGQEAWNAVRGNFTYDHIIKGPADKLGQRLHEVVENNPEFARTVYGDEAGARVLSNIDQISTAYDAALTQSKTLIEGTKSAGKSTVEAVKERARAGLEEATEVGSRAKEFMTTQGRAATGAVRRDVKAQTRQAQSAQDAAIAGAKAPLTDINRETTRLMRSSIAPYASHRMMESDAADALRVIGLGPGTIWAYLSMVRLLKSPKAADIIEWAALSDKKTQILTGILKTSLPDRTASAAMRGLLSDMDQMEPMPSHAQAQ